MNNTQIVANKKIGDNVIINGDFLYDGTWKYSATGMPSNFYIDLNDNKMKKDNVLPVNRSAFQQLSGYSDTLVTMQIDIDVDVLDGELNVLLINRTPIVITHQVEKVINVPGKYSFQLTSGLVGDLWFYIQSSAVTEISRIEIHQVKTFNLDTYIDEQIEITYQHIDFDEIFTRKTDFSKSISLPATSNNLLFFEFVNEISSSNNFEMGASFNVKVYNDTIENFDGYLELVSVSKNDYNEIVNFNVNLFGALKNFINKLGDAKMIGNDNQSYDIDLSKYNHELNFGNATGSWNYYNVVNGIMTDMGEPGAGYVYSLIDRGNMNNPINVIDLLPSPYIKELFDIICEKNDISYTSNFLNSDTFKKLTYVRLDKQLISDAEITKREVYAYRTYLSTDVIASQYSNYASYGRGNVKFNVETTDGYSAFSTTTGVWVCPRKGLYNLDLSIQVSSKIVNETGKVIVIGDKRNGVTLDSYGVFCYVDIYKNNTLIGREKLTFTYDLMEGDQLAVNAFRLDNLLSTISIPEESFEKNDILSVKLLTDCYTYEWNKQGVFNIQYGMGFATHYFFTYNQGSLINFLHIQADPSSPIAVGDTVDITSYLDKTQTQKSFISDIFNLFNLQVTRDKTDNKLIIEPYNDFWSSASTVHNWSDKRDINSELTIEAGSDLRYKNIRFEYVSDTDVLNKTYLENNEDVYGKYEYIMNKEYSSTYNIKLGFAPTPSSNFTIYTGTTGTKKINDMITPNISFIEDGSLIINRYAVSKPRILFYNGISSLGTGTTIYLQADEIKTSLAGYPFSSHFESIDGNSGDDLCFSTCEEYYQNNIGTGVTEYNLVNKYYKRYIEELLNKDTKKVTGYFNLNEVDIHNFSFRDKILVDGIYYRVLSIEDFNPNKLTKVNLIKLSEPVITFERRVARVNSAGVLQRKVDLGRNNNIRTAAVVLGSNNSIPDTASNAMVIGDNNNVLNYSVNTFSFGNNQSPTSNSFSIATQNIILDAPNINFGTGYTQGNTVQLLINGNGQLVVSKTNTIQIIDGNYDKYNQLVNIHMVEDGMNEVRGTNSTNNIFIIEDTEELS